MTESVSLSFPDVFGQKTIWNYIIVLLDVHRDFVLTKKLSESHTLPLLQHVELYLDSTIANGQCSG